jgi:outer membrane protein assembly factor BamA
LPYIDYNPADGFITGLYLYGSDYLGNHQVEAIGGYGFKSGRAHIQAGYTYMRFWPAFGINLFQRYTYIENSNNTLGEDEEWFRERGGDFLVSFPLSKYMRIDAIYTLKEVTNEFREYPGAPFTKYQQGAIGGSLVWDNVVYQEIGPISGVQFNIHGDFGEKKLGSDFYYRNYEGEIRGYINYNFNEHWKYGKRLVVATRLMAGYKKDDVLVFPLGGQDSLRGYGYHEFHGTRIALANLELRYPLFEINQVIMPMDLFLAKRLDFAVFGDAGRVWNKGQKAKFEDAEASVGAGLRFLMFIYGKIPLYHNIEVSKSVTDADRGARGFFSFGTMF